MRDCLPVYLHLRLAEFWREQQATQESPEYSIASWSLRNIDPAMHDDDFAIFTSLDLNLDALYAQTEHVLEDAGLTNFDGEFRYEMQLKCDEDGSFYMENLYSSVLPYDFLHIDRVLWYCKLTEELRARQHKSYKVRPISCVLQAE
jgi:hypothetical protein